MRVKRLEIQGFKSFKDKTVIHFDHTITGIVGPNGCGKSNIVDAFFWVMGEQSNKHMRASGSGDLIFNGSSKYTQLGMAEATLVLETDYVDTKNAPSGATAEDIPIHLRSKEVSVTRRVYRDGNGEYFINGISARLKDIHELFMDTGVGTKGYSIIEQGQIGRIVNAKPEERRMLVEEAAGIAKYKARKRESLRKMASAKDNLSRLNDIIQEIERNLASLERQAQKAKKYKEYKQQLFEKEINWGRRKIRLVDEKIHNAQEKKAKLEHELEADRAQLHSSETQLETGRLQQVEDSKELEALQNQIQEQAANLAREQSALDLSRRRQSDLSQQIETLQNERSELEQNITREKEASQARRSQLEEEEKSLSTLVDQVREAEEKVRDIRVEADTARSELDSVKNEIISSVSRASELKSQVAAMDARVESCESQLAKATGELEEFSKKAATLSAELTELERQAQEKDQLVLELKSRQEQCRQQQHEAKESFVQLNQLREQAAEKLAQYRSRLISLEELVAAHEGLEEGTKAVLEWSQKSDASQKLSLLADCFDVLPQAQQAFEARLESWLDCLVVEDVLSAKQAIGFAEQEQRGRAAFFVGNLNTIQSDQVSYAVLKDNLASLDAQVRGELGEFVSLRSSSVQHQGLNESFLQKVCVLDSFEWLDSSKLARLREILSGWTLVTLEGQVLHPNGILRGGKSSADPSTSWMGRKRVIEELQSKVQESQAELDGLQNKRDDLRKRLESLEKELEEASQAAQRAELEQASLAKDLERQRLGFQELESQQARIQSEKQSLEEMIEKARSDKTYAEEQGSQLSERRNELEGRLEKDGTKLEAYSQRVREQEAQLQKVCIEEASLRERVASVKRELSSAQSMLEAQSKRLNDLAQLKERAEKEQSGHRESESSIQSQIEELTHKLSERRETLSQLRDRMEQTSGNTNALLEKIKTLHRKNDESVSQVNELGLDIERLSADRSHVQMNLEEKYGPGCLAGRMDGESDQEAVQEQQDMPDPIVTQEMTEEDEKLLAEELEKLREKIRRIGEVNTMAIEEYDEIKKRHDYLCTERGDLEKSIVNLQDAIEHINTISVERFKKAFEAISNRFERLFPIIFGGGRAKLSLVYPQVMEGTEGAEKAPPSRDVLDAGIDILAQPPGKKIVNIGLLSGGEKALTALALIFAIFMVKPSPFCVLDEVDAPLDDANIGKFNALLKEMSEKTQFILITHNKKTMELNDTLYGVTMEEPGVSKMVSIELN